MAKATNVGVVMLIWAGLVAGGCDSTQDPPAQAGSVAREQAGQPQGDTRQKIGGLAFRAPDGWKALEGADRDGTRQEFAAQVNQGQGLKEFVRPGYPAPHLDQFYICQKPPHDGQIIAWTLELPPQSDFLTKIRETEEKGVKLREAELTSGLCRVVQIDGEDVIRVDVNMRNGARATNFHYWSKDNPTQVTIVMVGTAPDAQSDTVRQAESVAASMSLAKSPISEPAASQPAPAAATAAPVPADPGEQFRLTVETYFNCYMHAELDPMLGTLHPDGPMYPEKWALDQLRTSAASGAVSGSARVFDVRVTDISATSATASMKVEMRVDVQKNGNYQQQTSPIVVQMRKHDGQWRIWKIDK